MKQNTYTTIRVSKEMVNIINGLFDYMMIKATNESVGKTKDSMTSKLTLKLSHPIDTKLFYLLQRYEELDRQKSEK